MADTETTPSIPPKEVLYCGVCTFPIEYCEFSTKSFKKCKAWLQENHPEVYNQLYSEDALANAAAKLNLTSKQEKIEKSLQKQQEKAERVEAREAEKQKKAKIIIKRVERTKRKRIVSISGLEVTGMELKKLAKTFAGKFATGASVTKNAEKKEEVVIQGDVGEEVEEYLVKLLQEKGLTEVSVELTEEKAKKKKDPAAA